MRKTYFVESRRVSRAFFFLFLLLFTVNAKSQTVLLDEGFENTFPAAGWSLQNYTPQSNNWMQYFYEKHTGTYSAACYPNAASANSWIFTPGISMQAGKLYVLSYWVRTGTGTSLRTTIGTGNSFQSTFVTLHSSFAASPISFSLIQDTIACEATGSYYIGFNNYSVPLSSGGSLIDDVKLTRLDVAPCTTVSAGTISSNTASVCVNTSFTLTGSSLPWAANEGIKYAWQKSADGISWTNITDGFTYNQSINVTQAAATYYRLTDTCLASGISAVSNVVIVNSTPFFNCSCTPDIVNCFNNLSFTNVRILNSSVNNTGTCSTNGYGDFTGTGTANTYRNLPVSVQHTVASSSGYQFLVGAWIDFNHNGIFEANEFTQSGPFSPGVNYSQVFIPASALSGDTRMRLRIQAYFAVNPLQMNPDAACTSAGNAGETEDYKINIGDAASCSGAVSAGTISTVSSICPNTAFTITAENTTANQAQMRYAWQRSTDNVNWVNITNTSYLINALVTSAGATGSYRLTDTCTVSGQSSISNTVSVSINSLFTCYCTPLASVCTNSGIDSVGFNIIHNISGCSAGGYVNNSGVSTTVTNGTNYTLSIKVRSTTTTKYAAAWIDFNRNGVFETEEKVFASSSTGNILSGIVTVPFNVSAGETVMRVTGGAGASMAPCQGSSPGETEDYRVVLNVTSPLSNKFCYYVKKTAAGLNSGADWANAYTTLAAAFNSVHTGDTIKVAKGSYITGALALKDSVVVLGGYPDTGNPTDAERNFSSNQTIMSGNVGLLTDSTDNTKIILTGGYAIKGFLVDGFVIEGAYNNNYSGEDYGPLYFTNATGTFRNVVVRNSYNYKYGAVLNAVNSKLTFQNCFFENNKTARAYNTDCVFNLTQKSEVALKNCVVAKNNTNLLFNQSNSFVTVLNSTVFKNAGFTYVHDTSTLAVQNSIFYYNSKTSGVDTAEFKKDVYSALSVKSTITEVYRGDSYNGQEPKFLDTLRIAGADGKYFTADDGLRVMNPCSPAINAGDNLFAASLPLDVSGSPRIKNGIVDLGAYEVQEAVAQPSSVLYVNRAATGLNNGSSWQNAFTDLQSAFYQCSDTIKVAAGTYPVSLNDADASYRLTNKRVVIGGYPNTGNPGNSQVNPLLNKTKIDGTISGNTRVHIPVLSVNNDSTARMIGFEIVNASKQNYWLSDYAALKVSWKSAPYFERMTVACATNNIPIVFVSDSSSPKFYKCSFFNGYIADPNNETGRQIIIKKDSRPLFLACYVGRDTTAPVSPSEGAQIVFKDAGGTIDSCLFHKAVRDAVYNQNGNAVIKNTLFSKGIGRSIVSDASFPQITNCIFNDSAISYYIDYNGGAIFSINGGRATYDRCKFVNSYTYRDGGALAVDHSEMVVKNSVFIHCVADNGGVAANKGGRLRMINCASVGSASSGNNSYATSVFLSGGSGNNSELINCTIVASPSPNNSIITADTLKLYNCILWRYGYGVPMIDINDDIITNNNNNTAACSIKNSMLFRQRNTLAAATTIGINPKLLDPTIAEGTDRILFTSDDGMKPCTCSYAINHGDSALNPELADMLGLPRTSNGVNDIGAYELQEAATINKTYFVKQNAAAGGTGTSWATAYNSLQKAVLNNCADTIKIAKGTYKPAFASRDSTFNIYRGTTLMGGYPDSGNPGDADRNVSTFASILSGDIGVQGDSTDNSHSVVTIHVADTIVKLDGLVIERGNANYSPNPNALTGGGGISLQGNTNAVLYNCIIRNNFGQAGGGFYSNFSNLTVDKCVLTLNNSSWNGGGFYIQDAYTPINNAPWAPLLHFKNSVLYKNSGGAGTISGNGVISGQNNNFFENVIIYKNTGSAAGFRFSDNPYVRLTNCIFARNNNTTIYPGVSVLASNPYNGNGLNTYIFNSAFKENTIYGMVPNYENSDFYWQDGQTVTQSIPFQNMDYCAVESNQNGGGWNNVGIGSVAFRDIDDGPGPDGIWLTADDGLQATPCSVSVDRGGNAYAQNIPTDILGNNRIINGRVDIGAYEITSMTPIVPTLTISASDTIVCVANNITFTAQATGTNAATTWQWKKNGINVGTNSRIYGGVNLADNDVVNVTVTINNPCVTTQTLTSNNITIHVPSSITPSVSITSSANPACGAATVTFNATAVNGGASPQYQWKVNGANAGANLPFFASNTLLNNSVVTVVLTSSLSCASSTTVTSNAITQQISGAVTPSVTIAANAATCAGSTITFTGTAVNGGATPAYQWKVNGANAGTNSNTFSSSTLAENDVVTLVLTGSSPCATAPTAVSAPYTVHYSPAVAPSVSISIPSANLCTGAQAVFTAAALNAGNNPIYQWKVNGADAGTNSASFTIAAPVSGSIVSLTVTGGGCSGTATATSNLITITVTQPGVSSITISGNINITAGQSGVFTAAVTNAGTSPSYQWQDSTGAHSWLNIPGAQGNTVSYAPAATADKLRCLLSNAGGCNSGTGTSNVLSFNVTGRSSDNGSILRLFPNPVRTTFTIDSLLAKDHFLTIEIVGTDGRAYSGKITIVNKAVVYLDVSNLMQGMYFAVLRKADGGIRRIPFIKE
jgi:hypothetical protein